MTVSPKIKLSVDLHRMNGFFPSKGDGEDASQDLVIDRLRYDIVAGLLQKAGVKDTRLFHEFCYIILWTAREIDPGEGHAGKSGPFFRMRDEVDRLRQYLLHHRVISVTFRGETGRNEKGEEMVMTDEINIDRICDGLRSVFREEFDHGSKKRRKKGLTAWQNRKLARTRTRILKYLAQIPELDELPLEEQNELIEALLKA
jgi:hypothetical protein